MSCKYKLKDTNYINVQYWMVDKLGLTGNSLLVYAIIYGFSQDGQSTYNAGNEYLRKFLGTTEKTIKNVLSNLVDRGLITKKISLVKGKHDGKSCNEYAVVLDSIENTEVKNTPVTGEKITPHGGKNYPPTEVKNTPHNDSSNFLNIYKEKNKEIKKESTKNFNAVETLRSLGCEERTIRDWMIHRKNRKAAITETAINRIISQASEAGISLNNALIYSINRNWIGFDAEWYLKATKTTPNRTKKTSTYEQTMANVEIARELIFGGVQ